MGVWMRARVSHTKKETALLIPTPSPWPRHLDKNEPQPTTHAPLS